MRIVPILAILAIVHRLAFYALLKGVHDHKYFMQVDIVRDSTQFVIIGYLLWLTLRKQKGECRLITITSIWFCITLPVLLCLYAFLPDDITYLMPSIFFVYFCIWTLVAGGLCLYYLICIKGQL